MPIETDLSVSPYFDDYDADKSYYKTLFKPATAVQVRELNQLQTVLQEQIARFGDHILKRGTILDGCEASFQTEIDYIKVRDLTVDGAATDVEGYNGLMVKSANTLNNVRAEIIDYAEGYEAQDPDLNTLYLKYLDSGNTGGDATFVSNETVEVFSEDLRLYDFNIVNPSQGFANSDSVVILSSIEVQNDNDGSTTFTNTSGGEITFVVGNEIEQTATGAKAVIVSVDTTSNTEATVLQIKPRSADLALANTSAWNWAEDSSFTTTANTGDTLEAMVAGKIGSGASARLTTTGAGAIDTCVLLTPGEDYYVLPTVTISTTTATVGQLNDLDIIAENYKARLIVSSLSGSVGQAYGMEIDEGIIYQKGYFLTVPAQGVIVSKYSNTPSDVAVGFETDEFIVNSGIDSTLYDNAEGFENRNAPGADRLKLIPALVVKDIDDSDADGEFLPLFKFSEGKPYQQLKTTQYSKINEEMAQRTYDVAGDFVLDPFNMVTRSTIDMEDTASDFTYVIDPGYAYINGFRVKTERQYAVDVEKSIDTTEETTTIDAAYGNYIRVNNLGGVFASDRLQKIELSSDDTEYLANTAALADDIGATYAGSNVVGTARVRSFIHESGIMGTTNAVYRLYLFDIKMNQGKNFFDDVKSVVADAATGIDAVAKVMLQPKAGAGSSVGAVIYEPDMDTLLFDQELPMKDVNTISYNYRNLTRNVQANTSGVFTVDLEVGSTWPFSGSATLSERKDINIVPEEDFVDTLSRTGSNTSPTQMTLSSGDTSDFVAGNWVYVNGADWYQIQSIESSTVFTVTNTFTATYSSVTVVKGFPRNVMIPILTDSEITAEINGSNQLEVDLDISLSAAANVAVMHTQRVENSGGIAKTPIRKAYVKIDVEDDVNGGPKGPWSLGFTDVFRLRSVHLGSTSSQPTTSSTDVADYFYVENNQTPSQLNNSQLVLDPDARRKGFTVPSDAVFLVEFDLFTVSPTGGAGVKVVNSYPLDDTLDLADLTAANTHIHTMEIPEVNHKDGSHYDLRECLDFRPHVANEKTVETDWMSAPCANTLSVDDADLYGSGADFKIPVPDSDIEFTMEYYLPRRDVILLTKEGEFEIKVDEEVPAQSPNELFLYEAEVPPYPSLPEYTSPDMAEIIDTNCYSQKTVLTRPQRYTIETEAIEEQNEGYSMAEIAQLERRIEVLEYYALLSETENDVKTKGMPSSVDSTLERFKFGFFVDNFSDFDYTDTDHPTHESTLYDNHLQPSKKQIDIDLQPTAVTDAKYNSGFQLKFPHTRKKLLSQDIVTDGPVIPPKTDGGSTTIIRYNEPPVPAVKKRCVYVSNQNTRSNGRYTGSGSGAVYEETLFTMSGEASADGQELAINFHVYGGNDRIEIYQATSPGATFNLIGTSSGAPSGGSIRNLTSTERRKIANKGYKAKYSLGRVTTPDWWNKSPNYSTSGIWVKNTGTIRWNYSAAGGRYIKIRVVKGSPHHAYEFCFPGTAYSYLPVPTRKPPVRPVVIRTPVPPKPPKVPTKKNTNNTPVRPPIKIRPPIITCGGFTPPRKTTRPKPPRPPRPIIRCGVIRPNTKYDSGIKKIAVPPTKVPGRLPWRGPIRGCVRPVLPTRPGTVKNVVKPTTTNLPTRKRIVRRPPPVIRCRPTRRPIIPKPPTLIKPTAPIAVKPRDVTPYRVTATGPIGRKAAKKTPVRRTAQPPNRLTRAVQKASTPKRANTPISKPAPKKSGGNSVRGGGMRKKPTFRFNSK